MAYNTYKRDNKKRYDGLSPSLSLYFVVLKFVEWGKVLFIYLSMNNWGIFCVFGSKFCEGFVFIDFILYVVFFYLFLFLFILRKVNRQHTQGMGTKA